MEVRSRFTRAAAWLLAAAMLTPPLASADPKPKDWNPTIDPANFVSTVDNPYFPLPEGRVLRYRGETKDGIETLEITVTGRNPTIMGVRTTEMVERHALDGEIVEISKNWFAQDRDGNVWYFGEFSQSYENGVPAGTPGSWEAGVGDALPGIIMRADPQTGDTYFQEFAPGVAQDQAQVKSTTESTTVLQGSFAGVVVTKEWTSLEPNSIEKKYYAPGIGLIMEENGPERLELVQIID
ncbi:MAG: hypothetical protein ACRENJ_10075 [Candidatus Eiseniibacteriota bacterium]